MVPVVPLGLAFRCLAAKAAGEVAETWHGMAWKIGGSHSTCDFCLYIYISLLRLLPLKDRIEHTLPETSIISSMEFLNMGLPTRKVISLTTYNHHFS